MDAQPFYILHPGWISSRYDGDRHYITAARLADLYGVKMQQCAVAPENEKGWHGWVEPEKAIHLRPRYDGNYVLPVADEEKA